MTLNLRSTQTGITPAMKIIVRTEREVAYASPDHLVPWGTRRDNHTNQRFNDKYYKIYPHGTTLKILDLGCSGGGFVRNCLDDGYLAVGLEGSDYSRKHHRAEWRVIPECLFTCDITGDFEILLEPPGQVAQRASFDLVTAWEVMEHIAEPDIVKVAENVKNHLAPGGLWVMSVCPRSDMINGVELHQTIQPKPWWINFFARQGLEHMEEFVRYFNTQWVRGPKYGYADSFHLVLCRDRTKVPAVPHQGILRWVYDRWLGSMPQKFLAGKF